MKLTDVDKTRIALKMLVHHMAEEGLPTQASMKRELPNVAQKIDEKPEVLEAFIHELLPDIIRTRLGCDGVTLSWTN